MAIKGPATTVRPQPPSVNVGIESHLKGVFTAVGPLPASIGYSLQKKKLKQTAASIQPQPSAVAVAVAKAAQSELAASIQSDAAGVSATIGQIRDLAVSIAAGLPSVQAVAGDPVQPGEADADFLARSTLQGTRWFQGIKSDLEITTFTWIGGYGNDPGRLHPRSATVIFDTTDFVSGGGSMRIRNPAGESENAAAWIRPLEGIEESGQPGNVPDPAYIPGQPTYVPIQAGDGSGNFLKSSDGGGYGPEGRDGKRKFCVTFATKVDSRRELASLGGKFSYITHGTGGVSSQEVVHTYIDGAPYEHKCYAGYAHNSSGQWRSFQRIANAFDVPYVYDEWQQMQYEFVAGDEYEDGDGTGPRTQFRMYRQLWNQGQIDWELIWEGQMWNDPNDKSFALDYDNDLSHKAVNALIFNNLLNDIDNPEDVDHWIDEIICSDEPQPPKKFGPPRVLETACDDLVAGGKSYNPIAFNPASARYDISWSQVTMYLDFDREEIHLMRKSQNGGSARHFIYSMMSDNWRTTDSKVAPDDTHPQPHKNKLGHAWGTTFISGGKRNGTYFFIEQNPQPYSGPSSEPYDNPVDVERTIRYCDRAVEAGQGNTNKPWDVLPFASEDLWSPGVSNIYQPAIAYHPNLFGPGLEGLFCFAANGIVAYNFHTQQWTRQSVSSGSDFWLRHAQSGLYVYGHDVLLWGDGDSEDRQYTIIPAGGGLDLSQPYQQVTGPIEHKVGKQNSHKMILDPADRTRVIMLECKGNNIWSSNDGGQSWVDETAVNGYTHPFWDDAWAMGWVPTPELSLADGGAWTCCTLPKYGNKYGAILAAFSDDGDDQMKTMLWKPDWM